MNKNTKLPVNPNVKKYAKKLRQGGSLPEALLWMELKKKQISGLDFDRQKPIGDYIVDFFCAAHGLVLEIDDKATHSMKVEKDLIRDEYLKSLGLKVLRISAQDVLKSPGDVAEYLRIFLA